MNRTLPTFVHLDADAFFVGVEQALNPALRGRKVAVGGGVRGIIASASYEARACGVRTPMPTAQARRVCPDLIVVGGGGVAGGGMAKYAEFSRRLFDLCEDVTPFVERRSIDEGFMDVGPRGFADAAAVEAEIRALQRRISCELGISVSFGLAANRLVSAVASKRNKPRGFTVVPPGAEAAFLAPLPVGVLPGVGPKTENLLKSNGIVRVADVLEQPESLLAGLFGRAWREFVAMARGEDDSQISLEHEDAKSYSQQETFPADIGDFEEVLRIAKGMIDALMRKIRADGKCARTLTVKVRYPGMVDDTAGRSLPEAANLETSFYALAAALLRQAWRRRGTPLRLVMVKFSGIETPSAQLELFDATGAAAGALGGNAAANGKAATASAPHAPSAAASDNALERRRRLAAVVDALNSRTPRILRAHDISRSESHENAP